MRRLGIHSFVWTGGGTQAMLEEAMENSAACGYRLIEFAYLRPEKFDLDRLAQRARALDLEIAVTMGLPFSADVSSEDSTVVKAGEELLANAVAAVRDIGGTKAGVDLVLEVVNRFETNLLNTAAQGLDFIAATGSDHVSLHLDTFHMNIEEANPAAAIRLAGNKIGYFHIGESNRGYLGDGVIDFDRTFDALLDIGYDRDITFESFSSAVVDEGLSLACAIWRDTWTDNMPLAKHAKAFIDLKMEEAVRRRATNARP
jgi:D-psicose/D-tagatose/L-ribulose 3-epimerase